MRAVVDRSPWNATAIIGATSGRIGTRKRAGALEPPHHMYILRRSRDEQRDRREQRGPEQTKIRPAQHHPAAGNREDVDRRVHQQSELLIEQQAEYAAGNVRDEHVQPWKVAVRDLRIE